MKATISAPILYPIKGGWAAAGNGWAVHASTREEAIEKFRKAEQEHAEIRQRPLPEDQPV